MAIRGLHAALALVGVLALAAGCGRSAGTGSSSAPARHLVGSEEYLPGVGADVYLPDDASGRVGVVVLVPGGGWLSADRRGLAPLAESLADDGMVVVNATFRTAADKVVFPVPVQDVVCAVDFAVDRARRAGVTPGPVVLVGHSSGGQVAALAALAATHFRAACPYPPVLLDGFVGLAGAYDVVALSSMATALFGVEQRDRPDLWREGDPATWVGERTRARPLAVLLAHGSADEQLPTSMTTAFADRLRSAGHPVEQLIVPGADHSSIYRPDVIEPSIRDWVRTLPGDRA